MYIPTNPLVQVLLHSVGLKLIIFQVLFIYSSISGYYKLPFVGQFLKTIQKLKRAETIYDPYI